MIFALGTPIAAQCRPWAYDWTIKPDALMISAIDMLINSKVFQKVQEKGIHEFLEWDGKIICDSGAFSAINRKRKINIDIERLKDIYKELNSQDKSIIKITLDFPDDKIVENFHRLSSLEIQPVIPYDRPELIIDLIKGHETPEWIFIGRLVPFMMSGGGRENHLFPILKNARNFIINHCTNYKQMKLWALGVGAPSLIDKLTNYVDGCDSTRWRVTGSNMVLLPKGGERGVGNRTKWRGTHHRISDQFEKEIVISILNQIDNNSGGLENLDSALNKECYPKQLKGKNETDLPLIAEILDKMRTKTNQISIYELELLLRSSGTLRLVFNYWASLSFKTLQK